MSDTAHRLALWRSLLPVLVLIATGLLGCLPDGTPAYLDGGNLILATFRQGRNYESFCTYDVRTKRTLWHGSDLRPRYVRIVEDLVLVEWAVPQQRPVCTRFDPRTGKLSPAPPDLAGRLAQVVPVSRGGRKCLLVPCGDRYDVYSLPELKRQETLSLKKPVGAGDFWWLREVERGLEVVGPDSKVSATIPRQEIEKAQIDPRARVRYARVSPDEKAILLFMPGERGNTFPVFDTQTGLLLWVIVCEDLPFGTPLVGRNAVWTVEQEDPPDPTTAPSSKPTATTAAAATTAPAERPVIALVRYSPPGPGQGELARRQVVYRYTAPADSTLCNFAPSPDRSHFLAAVAGSPPRLLFMPLAASEKEVEVIELKAR